MLKSSLDCLPNYKTNSPIVLPTLPSVSGINWKFFMLGMATLPLKSYTYDCVFSFHWGGLSTKTRYFTF